MSATQPYKGNDSYIFISYSHRDMERVLPVIEKMLEDGYRVWYDEGIDPGSEWDENIARHVVGCSYFIAFVSKNYLASSNCKDELNYARDRSKHILLVYLEQVELSGGMEMRLNRLQYISKYVYRDETVFYEKLYSAEDICKMRDDSSFSSRETTFKQDSEEPPVRQTQPQKKTPSHTAAMPSGRASFETRVGGSDANSVLHPFSKEWFGVFGVPFFMKTLSALVASVLFVCLILFFESEAAETVGILFSVGVPLSLVVFLVGIKKDRELRQRRYLDLINTQGSPSLRVLAGTVGRTVPKTSRDLRRMIYDGKLQNAYVDPKQGVLVTKTPDPAEPPVYIPKSSAPIVIQAIAIVSGLIAIVAFGLMEFGGEEAVFFAFAAGILCMLFFLISMGLRSVAQTRLLFLILLKAYRIYSVRELAELSEKDVRDVYRAIDYFSGHHYLHAQIDRKKGEVVLIEDLK